MGSHRKSIIKEALDRFDSLMAIGESRREAKQERRSTGERIWTFSTGRIHSYKTRTTYQEHVLRFIGWARQTYQIKRLEDLDLRSEELASYYLQTQKEALKSPYTLQVQRSAFRLFFGNRSLAEEIQIPRRTRTSITRSRGPVAHDRHFQPNNWQPLLSFLQATGLRRIEVTHLKCGDVLQSQDGGLLIVVRNGKGGKSREVPVLPGRELDVLQMVAGLDPETLVFDHIPKHLDVHSYRRGYAQALYLHYAPERELPPVTGRLKPTDYDRTAVQRVSWALGHNRLDVVLRHYLR